MKLMYCKICRDVVRPLINNMRSCDCGACTIIANKDNKTIDITGEAAVVFGIHNSSFVQAVVGQPEHGMGKDFIAFVIPKNCSTVNKK